MTVQFKVGRHCLKTVNNAYSSSFGTLRGCLNNIVLTSLTGVTNHYCADLCSDYKVPKILNNTISTN